ncbi:MULTISPECIES: Bax inhibitor-1/YccA family membrane protein [unclassified Psychrobacter]|uniref:Bax inhibitor-1/YccA family protein n=1 Tax=unclassified Psychrobacter TaxID=196806 RepID=UPI0018F657CF|nr:MULTISPECIES: Bax inhibitor-1/YccA family protein [unclassified Psychrobacter]
MANPIVSRTELAVGGKPMTVKGVVRKTSMLLGLSAVSGLGFFFYALAAGLSSNFIYMTAIVSMFAGVGLSFLMVFKPHLAKTLAVPYALLEGLFLGGISMIFAAMYPSVPLTALCATFVTAAVMLGLYRSGVIKVTDKFRSIMMSAIFAIMLLYIVQWGFAIFGSSLPFLFDGGMIAIGFSLFVVVIASFSLLLDFDNIERGVAMGVSDDYEWIFSVGIMATLVWMYVEFLRLLSYLQD